MGTAGRSAHVTRRATLVAVRKRAPRSLAAPSFLELTPSRQRQKLTIMQQPSNSLTTRRDFTKPPTRIAAASSLAGVALPHVHAASSDLIQLALIGCGNRGTGAAVNALSTGGPVKLVAMADVFSDRLNRSFDSLKKEHGDKVAVPPDHKFIGFHGYQKAMDCLKPRDVAIFTTPLAFPL